MGWRHRRRHGTRGRFPKPISIEKVSTVDKFTPTPQGNSESVYIEPAELEALRLVDLEGLSQEEAGERMVSPEAPSGGSYKVRERRQLKPSLKEDQYALTHLFPNITDRLNNERKIHLGALN